MSKKVVVEVLSNNNRKVLAKLLRNPNLNIKKLEKILVHESNSCFELIKNLPNKNIDCLCVTVDIFEKCLDSVADYVEKISENELLVSEDLFSKGLDESLGQSILTQEFKAILLALEKDVKISIITNEEYESFFPKHSGIFALADFTIDDKYFEYLKGCSEAKQVVMVGDSIQDSFNVGSMIRLADAFGVTASIFTGESANPQNYQTIKSSVGSVFRTKVFRDCDAKSVIENLKKLGFTICVTALNEKSITFSDLLSKNGLNKIAWVFGNERRGVSDEIIQLADYVVKVEMSSDIDSLNVSHCAGICLYNSQNLSSTK